MLFELFKVNNNYGERIQTINKKEEVIQPTFTNTAISQTNFNNNSTYFLKNSQNLTINSAEIDNLTVNSGEIDLSNNILKVVDGDLYFNNELLAKAGDIQDIADWSNYPALFNIDMNGNKILFGSNTLDVSNNNLEFNGVQIANINDVSNAISEWSLNKAVSNVDLSNNNILNIGQLKFGNNTLDVNNNNLEFNNNQIANINDVINWSENPAVSDLEMGIYKIKFGSNTLDVSNNNLEFNGVQIANINDLSGSVAAWSLNKAVSNVDLSNNNMINVGQIKFGNNILDVSNNKLEFNNIQVATVNDLSGSVSAWSLNKAVSFIDANNYPLYNVSNMVIGGKLLDVCNNNLQFNNIQIPNINQVDTEVSKWSHYIADGTVNMNNNDIGNIFEIRPLNITVSNFENSAGNVNIYGNVSLNGNYEQYIKMGCLPVLGINTCRVDILPTGTVDIVAPAAISMNCGGAANWAIGGALSLAAGGYIEMNTGDVKIVNSTSNQSNLYVNNIYGNTTYSGNGKLSLYNVDKINNLDINKYLNNTIYDIITTNWISSFTGTGILTTARILSNITASNSFISVSIPCQIEMLNSSGEDQITCVLSYSDDNTNWTTIGKNLYTIITKNVITGININIMGYCGALVNSNNKYLRIEISSSVGDNYNVNQTNNWSGFLNII